MRVRLRGPEIQRQQITSCNAALLQRRAGEIHVDLTQTFAPIGTGFCHLPDDLAVEWLTTACTKQARAGDKASFALKSFSNRKTGRFPRRES